MAFGENGLIIMCNHQISIYNRSSSINFLGNAFKFEVPCGKCIECQQAKHQEYLLRALMEYRQTTEINNGFVYFDTLTYSNKHLPRFKGMPCFRKKDLSVCLKKLRVYLERAGYDVKGHLKYFITSEFGGKTHRPHYHVLFFISIPNLDVKKFWKALRKSWIYGIIDRYKTCPNRVVNSSAALSYVAKYVGKDQEWNEESHTNGLAYTNKVGLTNFQPFHLQSQGFGANFLNFVSLETILKKGIIEIKEKGYIKRFQLPNYYKRKLFYYFDKDEQGKVHWHLTEDGIEWKCNRLEDKIQNCEQRFRDIYYNLGYLDPMVKTEIDYLLDGRSLRDFAEYVSVYRNKMWLSDSTELPSLKDFYRSSFLEGEYINPFYTDNSNDNRYYREVFRDFVIDENDYRFQDRFYCFDRLLSRFRQLPQQIADAKEKVEKEREALRSRLKLVLITN